MHEKCGEVKQRCSGSTGHFFLPNETEETQQMCTGVVDWKINNLESNAVFFCLHGAPQTDQEQPATDGTWKVLLATTSFQIIVIIFRFSFKSSNEVKGNTTLKSR